ncbi:MAG: PQQ-dependent sugar dehydrogenase [Gammaproteobacteria bacterium]|nr:PQQ-dependent sugar dehydrogenase [Gammaproteobacteria bacterium]
MRRSTDLVILMATLAFLGPVAAQQAAPPRAGSATPQGEPPPRGERFIGSAYHPVQIRYFDDLIPQAERQWGGAIERFGDDYIGVTGAGAFYRIDWDEAAAKVTAVKLPIAAPHSAAAFDAAADPVVNRTFFRVIDLIAERAGNGWRLYASHHQWLTERNCLVMRISAIDLDAALQPAGGQGAAWHTVYDTTPCLTLDRGNRGRIFAGHESGARMAWLAPGQLLFTVGDQEHDDWNQPIAMAQSDAHMYGKILQVDVASGRATIYSKGHRNPQGLYRDGQGNLWESEHGPRGGDEINLVRKGQNYGWPTVTYGTDYGRFVWPPAADRVGTHPGYAQPIYAFIPSIATSNLIRIEGDTQFTAWRGNLLVAGLASQSLIRLGLDGERVVFAEPLPIGRRIRDLIVGPAGRLWLWGENGDLVALSVATSQHSGAMLFQTCAGCHTTGVTSGGLGPSLYRVVGRRRASRTDYVYSPAFKALDGTWTEELLDRFLADPEALVPGTAMNTIKVPDAAERKALVDYLRDLQ